MWFEFYKFLSGALIITGGYFIGCTIVSVFVYEEQKEIATILSEEENQEKASQEYVDKYLEDYKVAERELVNEETLKSLKTITDDTPYGIVTMQYSHDAGTFRYWCDKQIPYKILESVSRKYVIDNNCKSIHYDMEEDITKKREAILDATEKLAKQLSGLGLTDEEASSIMPDSSNKPMDSVFVTFKKSSKPAKPAKMKEILCDNANRYSYVGQLKNIPEFTSNSEKKDALKFSEYLKWKEENKESSNIRNELQTTKGDQEDTSILEYDFEERNTPSPDDTTLYDTETTTETTTDPNPDKQSSVSLNANTGWW